MEERPAGDGATQPATGPAGERSRQRHAQQTELESQSAIATGGDAAVTPSPATPPEGNRAEAGGPPEIVIEGSPLPAGNAPAGSSGVVRLVVPSSAAAAVVDVAVGEAATGRPHLRCWPSIEINGDSEEEAQERRRGRERKGRPVGRYLMCVHVTEDATQISVLEGRSLVQHVVGRQANDVTEIDGNIYLARVANVLPGWRPPSSTSARRRMPSSTGAM